MAQTCDGWDLYMGSAMCFTMMAVPFATVCFGVLSWRQLQSPYKSPNRYTNTSQQSSRDTAEEWVLDVWAAAVHLYRYISWWCTIVTCHTDAFQPGTLVCSLLTYQASGMSSQAFPAHAKYNKSAYSFQCSRGAAAELHGQSTAAYQKAFCIAARTISQALALMLTESTATSHMTRKIPSQLGPRCDCKNLITGLRYADYQVCLHICQQNK